MKRRQFLRALFGTTAAAAGFSLGNAPRFGFNTASAHVPVFDTKTLVFVYLRGGNDGINTVIPHGYPAGSGYYAPGFRPNIAIPKPVPGDLTTALDLGGGGTANGLGLHPAMESMWQLYQNGNLAIMPAVHYANASRSHFSSQQFTESAKSDLETDGWLNRYLVDVGGSSDEVIRGVGLSGSLPHMLRGQELVSAFSDLRSFELGITNPAYAENEAEVLARLLDVYGQDPDANRKYANLIHEFGGVTLKDLDIVADLNDGTHPELDPDTYVTASTTGSDYGSSTFHRQLKQTAILIKAGRGLEVASLSRGGFDLHSNEGGATGNHFNALRDVSDGLLAFFDDLNVNNPDTARTFMEDVLVLVGSEFGRTSYENGSFGVDHAHATAWFALSREENVNGGVYLGHENSSHPGTAGGGGVSPGGSPQVNDPSKAITDWIGYDPLNDDNMIYGRYLDHTIDYRNLYGEILNNFLSQNYFGGSSPNLATLLPDFTYSEATKIGFLT